MDVNISEVFENRRRKMCVVIDFFKYSKFRETKDKCKIFRCINCKCKVTAKYQKT